MILFIKYNSYETIGSHAFQENIGYATINQYWDISCRPDPDFNQLYPSTGLCRSPTVQKFILSNHTNIDRIFYFYTFNSNHYVAIVGSFCIRQCFNTHMDAHVWFSRHAHFIPFNVVINNIGQYRPCMCTGHTQFAPPDIKYFKRRNNPYIILEWKYNRINHSRRPIILPTNNFVKWLISRKASLLGGELFNNLGQLQNTAIKI